MVALFFRFFVAGDFAEGILHDRKLLAEVTGGHPFAEDGLNMIAGGRVGGKVDRLVADLLCQLAHDIRFFGPTAAIDARVAFLEGY